MLENVENPVLAGVLIVWNRRYYAWPKCLTFGRDLVQSAAAKVPVRLKSAEKKQRVLTHIQNYYNWYEPVQ